MRLRRTRFPTSGLVSCCEDGTATVLDLSTGQPTSVLRPPPDPPSTFFGVQVSSATCVLTGYEDSVTLVSVKSGSVKSQVSSSHGGIVWGVAHLPRSRNVAVGGDRGISLYDDSDLSSKATFRGSDANVVRLRHHHFLDPNLLFSGSTDGVCRIWDLSTTTCLKTLQCDNDGALTPIYGLSIDPFHQLIFTGSHYGEVRIWDSRSHRLIHTLQFSQEWVESLLFRETTQHLVVTVASGQINIFDLRKTFDPMTSFHSNHDFQIYDCCDVPDPSHDMFVTSGYVDACVKAWKESGKEVWHYGPVPPYLYGVFGMMGEYEEYFGEDCMEEDWDREERIGFIGSRLEMYGQFLTRNHEGVALLVVSIPSLWIL